MATGGDAPRATSAQRLIPGDPSRGVLGTDREWIRFHILPGNPLPVALVPIPSCAPGEAVFLTGDEFLCKVIASLGSGIEGKWKMLLFFLFLGLGEEGGICNQWGLHIEYPNREVCVCVYMCMFW